MAKYTANMKLAPGPQHLKQEKGKSKEKKGKKRKLAACENKRKRAFSAFSAPWEEPPLPRVLVFSNWKQLIAKPYIC